MRVIRVPASNVCIGDRLRQGVVADFKRTKATTLFTFRGAAQTDRVVNTETVEVLLPDPVSR